MSRLYRCTYIGYHEIINFVISDRIAIQKSFLDAVKRGQLDKVKKFHQQGAKPILPDSNGWTPLHHAARLGRTQVVQYIADIGEWHLLLVHCHCINMKLCNTNPDRD